MTEWLTKIRSKIDGRFFLFGSHLLLVITGLLFYKLQRTSFQIISAILFTVLTEFLCVYFFEKFEKVNIWDRLLSALSIIFGFLVLVNSTNPYLYALGGSIAILSKYLIRKPSGEHIYNPTNFAIIFSYAVMPLGTMTAYPDEFTIQTWPYISVTLLGICATVLSGKWVVTLAYIFGVILMAAALSPVFKMPFYYLLAPDIGLFGIIFMFLMITDPRTAPKSTKGMIIYGISIAVISIALRDFEFMFSFFIALFIVVSAYQLRWLAPEALKRIKFQN